MKSIELAKARDKSLVAIVRPDNTIKEYVVCTGYDSSLPYGSQWCWGHYHISLETALEDFKERSK